MKILFFYPGSFKDVLSSGSRVRPKILHEHLEKAAEVVSVCGESNKRMQAWDDADWQGVAGVYGELVNMPLALADEDHIPKHPFRDMRHLRKLKRQGVPVALFYRDIYWRFPHFKEQVGRGKWLLSLVFYYLELWQLRRSVSHLFLPSRRMLSEIPIEYPADKVSALPPGAEIRQRDYKPAPHLRLFYVGGVRPPLYDMGPMLAALARVPAASLTLCCRPEEWREVQARYDVPPNVEVVHASGEQLDPFFDQADVFLMFRQKVRYLEFAMPVKLFEAIGVGLPVITNADTEMGDFVEREHCGWTVESVEALVNLLERLQHEPETVAQMMRTVERVRYNHTWEARAREALDVLSDSDSQRSSP